MRRFLLVVGGVLLFIAILAVATASFHIFQFGTVKGTFDDDEAPIVVKNGSMDLFAGVDGNKHWKWKKKQDNGKVKYVHEPKHLDASFSQKDLFVLVRGLTTTTCTPGLFRGSAIKIAYNDGFYVTFSREDQFVLGSDWRSSLDQSADKLELNDKADPPFLRYPDTSSGYIRTVSVDGADKCTFAQAGSLSVICVASKDPSNSTNCQ